MIEPGIDGRRTRKRHESEWTGVQKDGRAANRQSLLRTFTVTGPFGHGTEFSECSRIFNINLDMQGLLSSFIYEAYCRKE
jgi:hypothetical protein